MIGGVEIVCRLPLVFTVGYLARTVGTEAYGAWALIQVFQLLLAGLAGLGLSSALSRLAATSGSEESKGLLLAALNQCGRVLLGMLPIVWVGAGVLGAGLGVPERFQGLLPLAVVFAAGGVADGLLDAYFKSREAVGRQILFVLARTAAEVVAVFGVFYFAASPDVAAENLLAGYMLAVAGVKLGLYPWLVRRGKAVWPGKGERERFFAYGLPMIPVVLVSWFSSQGDRLILGRFLEPAQLGVYTFGASLAAYVIFLGYAIYPLLLGRASRLYDQGQTDALAQLFVSSQALFLALFLPMLITISLFRREIVTLTAGPAFLPAADILWVLTIGVGLEGTFGIYQYVFHLVKQPRWILWLSLAYAVMLAGCVTTVGFLGGTGLDAAWGIVGVAVVFQGMRFMLSRRLHPLSLRAPIPVALVLGILAGWGLEWLAGLWGMVSKGVLFLCVWGLAAGALWLGKSRWMSVQGGISETVGG